MKGLPHGEAVQDPAVIQLLEILVLNDGLVSTSVPAALWPALNKCFAEGWVHCEETDDGKAVVYYLVSELHRWYCQRLLVPSTPQHALPYSDPVSLAVGVIRQFRAERLANPLRNIWAPQSPSPGDAYRKEFYRSLFTLAGGYMTASPEFVGKTGPGGIDFLLSDKKWGFELVRDRDRLPELVDGFSATGEDGYLLEYGIMSDYVILDFTTTKPSEAHPGKNHGQSVSGTLLIGPRVCEIAPCRL